MQTFFDQYGASFARLDMTRIAGFFAYPCMITNQAGTDLICDADALGQHIEGFWASVHDLGLVRAQPTILDDRVYGDANRTALVRWELFGPGDEPLDDPYGCFTYFYVLAGGPDDWKIQLANLI